MKKFFILTALIALFGVTSCEKAPSKAIVGSWKAEKTEISYGGVDLTLTMEEVGYNLTATFNEDGTGTFIYDEGGESDAEVFTYAANGKTLTITSYGETEVIPYEINGKDLILSYTEEEEGEVLNAKMYFKKL